MVLPRQGESAPLHDTTRQVHAHGPCARRIVPDGETPARDLSEPRTVTNPIENNWRFLQRSTGINRVPGTRLRSSSQLYNSGHGPLVPDRVIREVR